MQEYMDIVKKITASLVLGLLLSACGASSTGENSSQNNLSPDGTTIIKDKQNSTATAVTEDNKQVNTASLQTRAPAKDVTASDNALFIAEGDQGVEIIQIGYHDTINYNLVTTITGINATAVTLSKDQTKLYVQNREGFINVYDVHDIQAPRKIKILTKNSLQTNPVSSNGIYEYAPKEKFGLTVYDISNPSSKSIVGTYKKNPIYALVLVDQGTKALAATKNAGIILLDVSIPEEIKKLNTYPLEGETLGLSVNPLSGLLFIANGDKGIKVFNLNIFLDQLR